MMIRILSFVLSCFAVPALTAQTDHKPLAPVDGIHSLTYSISLNGNTFDMEVSLDADRIASIDLVNLSESTKAAFPLMKPALESLAAQIYQSQSLENITYPDDQKYTSQLLLSSIKSAIEKGTVY